MVECNLTYDLLPNVDQKSFAAWSRKATEETLKAPGLIEFRSNRGLIAPAQERTSTDWQTMADWTRFVEGLWQHVEAELRTYATNIGVELWGPSPINPEPLRRAR